MSMKEIVTKAIIGKSKKDYTNTYTVEVEKDPSTVLGCWIINHKFQAKEEGNKVRIDGNFDVNIWYSYDNDSKTIVNSKTTITTVTKLFKSSHACFISYPPFSLYFIIILLWR